MPEDSKYVTPTLSDIDRLLWDQYASAALPAAYRILPCAPPEAIAQDAARLADAMLEERRKRDWRK